MALDELVKEIVPYNPKPVWWHFYVWPFVILYASCLSTWTFAFGGEHFEGACIAMAVVGLLQVLAVLFCQWFVSVRCWMTCAMASNAHEATLVRVVPTPNNGSSELVALHKSKNANGDRILWFVFQKLKYVYDDHVAHEFRAVSFPTDRKLSFYQQAKGYEEETVLTAAKDHYGNNKMDMVIPTFAELFQERATAPFFVFQVFCVGLWCLDEYWYYSVFTLFMLVMFEATLVKQQLRNMAEIRNMGNKPYMINVYRARKWIKVLTDDLVVGDIVSVSRSKDETLPCDILVLRGNCIVDESMLTGESVLQMKESVEEAESQETLDIESDGKLFVLFGGTKVVQHTPPAKNSAGLKAPDNGCVGYVLRTGFNTSQGRLLRTILFGVKRLTANNKETFGFILFLLIFAIAASSYVWIKGTEDENRNKYKLFLECTLILTSVVPPELPIELSLAVNNSLLALQKLGVYCTEPFRIPFAGKVDICCFDKTGTLTTDNLIVEGVAGLGGSLEIGTLADAPLETVQVLASCHSLVQMEDEMVGDPLEKACLAAVDWSLTRNDTVIPKKSKQLPLRIIHRYHFSSAMKRMSVVVGYIPVGTSDIHHIATVKGAPETLKSMFLDAPQNYDDIYQKFTRQGARVLALGYKPLGQLSHQQVRDLTREELESRLHYAGFVIVSCPLKIDSKAVIKEIQYSSHQVVMITGDNPLTACHVAKELRFTKNSKTLILDQPEGQNWKWISVDRTTTLDVLPARNDVKSFIQNHDFCITGQAFTYLSETHPKFLAQLLPHVKVFARMAPKQKEYVITSLKRLGHITLMCGDGTNDVGALKHADVGVALLSHPLIEKPKLKEVEANEPNGPKKSDASNATSNNAGMAANAKSPVTLPPGIKKRTPLGKREDARAAASVAQMTATQKKFQKMLEELEEAEKAQIVRLGDASVAAPFTSKYSSIQSTCQVIKQGRCTLVTTLQMFKILALNALVLAYSQSVLYLDGIKFSDTQATVQGLLLAACFLFISRSKPLKTLSRQRPLTNIFNAYTLLTVTSQFAVHFLCLVHLVQEAHALSPPREEKFVKLDKEFKPNILNTTVYIISVALQISTFAVNYRGRPFMESLLENKALAWSLLFASSSILALASGLIPDISEKFELVVLPSEHRNRVLLVLAADMFGCLIVDRILQFLLGDVRVRGKNTAAGTDD